MKGRPIIAYCTLLAVVLRGTTALAQEKENLQLSVMTGYAQENLHWSIAGNSYGQSPNVYSELSWKHTGGPSLQARLTGRLFGRWTFFAQGSRVFIHSGAAYDTDYRDDNRTNASYHRQFDSDKGYTAQWAAGIGYTLIRSKRIHITPAIGYVTSYQSLYLTDHNNFFGQLNSSYNTQWNGPLARVSAILRLAQRWKLSAGIIYSQLRYSAKADWNLIQNFSHPVSFRHTAAGYGIDINAGIQYSLSRCITVEVQTGYFNRQTGTGNDELYLSSGQNDKTQLNGVGTDGRCLLAGLKIGL